jgi:hypothetical protein
MVFNQEEVDKVVSYKSWSDKRKQDKLLEMDCSMYAHLGIDSTKKDREDVKKASRRIYTAIKSINFNMGTLFLQTMDKNITKEPL